MTIGAKTRRVEPDITVVELEGSLTLGGNLTEIERLIKRLIDEGARKLALDLAALKYIDSAAIGMLVGVNGHMGQAGGKIRVAGAQGPVAKVFEVVHMHRIVQLDANVDASLASLSANEAAGS